MNYELRITNYELHDGKHSDQHPTKTTNTQKLTVNTKYQQPGMKKLITFIFIAASLVYLGCRKPFNPKSISGFTSALIVEGVLNPAGPTNIYLSRTLDLDDKVAVRPELKAVVQVLSESNTAVTLTDRGAGLYSIPQLTINSAQKYRLKITTSGGAGYISDPMAVKNTPAMDSLYWQRSPEGVSIYVDTHDSQNKTKYYQWDFEEDWELRSVDFALYRGIAATGGGVTIVSRDPNETARMYTCYKYQRSTNINIFSTAKLSSDIVSRHPILSIPGNSDKLSVRYSILVRQYALSFEAFEYLSMMKRNTEQLGSFFDAQPSELIGNIRNVSDSKDVAIGYVVIAPVLEKRIFIDRSQVPNWGFKLNCQNIVVRNHRDSLAIFLSPESYVPQSANYSATGGLESWNGTPKPCMDCRSRGGNNNKPVFW